MKIPPPESDAGSRASPDELRRSIVAFLDDEARLLDEVADLKAALKITKDNLEAVQERRRAARAALRDVEGEE